MVMRNKGLAFLVLLSAWHAAAAAEPAPDVVQYRVAKGDSLYTLAQRYLLRPGDYRIVQRLNQVADPYRMPVATTLSIPRKLLRHEPVLARVSAQRGAVQARIAGRMFAVTNGMVLGEGAELATGPNAFVTLRLPDGSIVTLPSQTRVTVDRLRRITLTGEIERRFRLLQGRTRSIVEPGTGAFEVSTPVAVAAVRGTEFRVAHDGDGRHSVTEVLAGEVAVAADGDEPQLTRGGFGTVVAEGRGSRTVKLLPAPSLLEPGRIQDGERLSFEIMPLADASSYRAQVAQDAGFLDLIAEGVSATPRVDLPPIPDGSWFVRVSALDGDGVEGFPETYSFERRLNRIETAMNERRSAEYREYLFRWDVQGEGSRRFRFQLSRVDTPGSPLVDEPGLTAQGFVITDLPAGTYEWRVQTLQLVDGKAHVKWSRPERFTITSP